MMGGRCFESQPSHFFKVILSDALQNGRLGIPKKFVMKYGSHLPDLVRLQVCSGDAWEVELVREDDGIWLRRGWPDFVNHYAIELGHFLVFRYEGGSAFHVVIFDKSMSEIEYPVVSETDDPRTEGDAGDTSVEVFEVHSDQSCQNLWEELPSSTPSSPSSKKRKTNERFKGQAVGDEHGDGHISNSNDYSKRMPSSSKPRFRVTEEVKLFSRAASFETKNPFFIALMRPSYVQPRYTLNIPLAFFTTHVSKTGGTGFIKLLGSGGRVWTVKYHVGMYRKPVRAQVGWRTFVRDNDLQKGDACVFELVTSGSFKVVIYKANQRSTGSCSSDSMRNDTVPIKNQTNHPFKSPIEEKMREVKRARHTHQGPSKPPLEVLVKRGRGRPKKTRSRDEEIEPSIEVLVKRGRGRPKKTRSLDEEIEPPIEVLVKRGRGRPKKEIEPPTEVQVKRGRGRPKKIRSRDEEIKVIEI